MLCKNYCIIFIIFLFFLSLSPLLIGNVHQEYSWGMSLASVTKAPYPFGFSVWKKRYLSWQMHLCWESNTVLEKGKISMKKIRGEPSQLPEKRDRNILSLSLTVFLFPLSAEFTARNLSKLAISEKKRKRIQNNNSFLYHSHCINV